MSDFCGTLYVVATPIGHLGDLSHRAKEVLGTVNVVAAEDTRHSLRLLNHYGVHAELISLHEHNEASRSAGLVDRLRSGVSVALISDAGTPLISDPGFRLVSQAREAGVPVSPVPGPNAAIAALSVAGLPTDRFVFEGFLPAKPVLRASRLQTLASEPRTLVFYESCHRIAASVRDMAAAFGEDRRGVIARELTKIHESFDSAGLGELARRIGLSADQVRGEFVVVVAGSPPAGREAGRAASRDMLRVLLRDLPAGKAARAVSELTGQRRNDVYRWALELQDER